VHVRLLAQNGELVAQFKATVLLMPNGSDRITSAPLQALQSEKKVESEELRKLLASSVKSKKKNKPKKKKGGSGAAAKGEEGGEKGGEEGNGVTEAVVVPEREPEVTVRVL
jgi:hypothetical protein